MIPSHSQPEGIVGQSATAALADFILNFPGGEISDAAIAEAGRTLVNYLGCSIAGAQHETAQRLSTALAPFFGAAQAAVLGRSQKTDVLHAALLNGTANNVYGFDDTHLETITHPGGPVLSALLALADYTSFSGRALLEALVIGVEVTCRVALALGKDHVEAGWHVSSTAGTFGAAAAAARVLRLTSRQAAQMFAIAAAQPTGLRANFGTMTVSLHIGLAARNGLAAALLAQQGFTGHEEMLDLADGWAKALSPSPQMPALVAELGQDFAILRNSYKPYASGIVTHPIIDGCIDLATAHELAPQDVSGIDLRVHPLVHELTGRMPTSALRSKVSVQHAAAVGLARRAGGIAEFSEAALIDPQISRLRDLVRYQFDASLRRDEARVRLTCTDGRSLKTHIPHARGSEARPMTDADLWRKFDGLTQNILPRERAERLFAVSLAAEDLSAAAEITALACP